MSVEVEELNPEELYSDSSKGLYHEAIAKKDNSTKSSNKKLVIAILCVLVLAFLAVLLIHQAQQQPTPYKPNNEAHPTGNVTANPNSSPAPTPPVTPEPVNPTITVDYGKSPGNSITNTNATGHAIYISPTGNGGANTMPGAPLVVQQAGSTLYHQNATGQWVPNETTTLVSTDQYAYDLNGDNQITSNEITTCANANYVQTNVVPALNGTVVTYTNQSAFVQCDMKINGSVYPTNMTISEYEKMPQSMVSNVNFVLCKDPTTNMESLLTSGNYSTIGDSTTISALNNATNTWQAQSNFPVAAVEQYYRDLGNYLNNNGLPLLNANKDNLYLDIPTIATEFQASNNKIQQAYWDAERKINAQLFSSPSDVDYLKIYAQNLKNEATKESLNVMLKTTSVKDINALVMAVPANANQDLTNAINAYNANIKQLSNQIASNSQYDGPDIQSTIANIKHGHSSLQGLYIVNKINPSELYYPDGVLNATANLYNEYQSAEEATRSSTALLAGYNPSKTTFNAVTGAFSNLGTNFQTQDTLQAALDYNGLAAASNNNVSVGYSYSEYKNWIARNTVNNPLNLSSSLYNLPNLLTTRTSLLNLNNQQQSILAN